MLFHGKFSNNSEATALECLQHTKEMFVGLKCLSVAGSNLHLKYIYPHQVHVMILTIKTAILIL